MKKFITIFLLTIISIQFLPVKQMGKALFDNQFVEEEVCKKGVEKSAGIEPGSDLLFFDLRPNYTSMVAVEYILINTALHKPPVTDIVAPPPNAIS